MTDKQPIRIVTSMDKHIFHEYGKKMILSTLEHWPGELWVFYPGAKQKPNIKHKRLKLVNLSTVPGFDEFMAKTSAFPIMQGLIDGHYNYRLNAHTFSIKPFAQFAAMEGFDGLLFWLDADTFTVEDISEHWLRGLFQGQFMVYQGRPEWHCCASFTGWDARHPHNIPFWTEYAKMLMSGKFLALQEWHDSFWLDALREGMGISARNIAEDLPVGGGPANVFDIVFNGKAHHYKGKKKEGPQRYAQLIELVRKVQPEVVIEVGTWNGGRALEMAQVAPGLRYYGFDLFEQATAQTDEEEKNVKPHYTHQQVQEMLIKAGVAASLMPGNTKETMPLFRKLNKNVKADLIYIDGGHAVETIRSDYENAKQMIKPGGLIVFDDYYVDMPEEDLEKWGANKVLEREEYELLPIIDPVKGGGGTQLAVVRC